MARLAHEDALVANDGSKAILSLVMSAAPIWVLIQQRAKLGLDALHLGLVQIVLLLFLKTLLNYIPSFISSSTTSSTKNVNSATDSTETAVAERKTAKRVKKKVKKVKKGVNTSAENSLYPPEKLDTVTSHFLSATAPEYLDLVGKPLTDPPIAAMPLEEWKVMYQAENIEVKSHPKSKMLFAISATYPDVPLRQLFETLIKIDKRKEWDGMCEDTADLDKVEVGGRRGSCSWLAMKGMGPIKAKDMVLLSMANQLPPLKDEPDRIRIICATQSFEHPSKPPTSNYNRMELTVSGFIAEKVGENGSKVTQITDLSGLGRWIPGTIINTVTQTMLPKSLAKLGKTAAKFDLEKESLNGIDGEWLPPVLGQLPEPSQAEAGAVAAEEADDDESEYEDEDDVIDSDAEEISASEARNLNLVAAQLKNLTNRLNALETGNTNTQTAKKGWWTGLGKGGIADPAILTAAGTAAGAAVAMALLRAYQGRRN